MWVKRTIAILAVGAALLVACGGSSSDSRAKALDRRERALDKREKQLDEREQALSAPTATTTTAPSPNPREIPIDSIQDQRIRNYFQMNGASTAVELAPGVYAEKGQGPVGNAKLYTSIVGLCADVNAYQQAHGPHSNSCW
jgi:hypothetical protein